MCYPSISLSEVKNNTGLGKVNTKNGNFWPDWRKALTVLDVLLRQKIKELAELRDWSIAKVATNAKVPYTTLDGGMNGRELGVQTAMRIAKTMDVPVEWLFDDKKGWNDLSHRPFWLPPGISPGQEIEARRQLEKNLGVTEEDVAAARKRRPPQHEPHATGSQAVKPASRRKSVS